MFPKESLVRSTRRLEIAALLLVLSISINWKMLAQKGKGSSTATNGRADSAQSLRGRGQVPLLRQVG